MGQRRGRRLWRGAAAAGGARGGERACLGGQPVMGGAGGGGTGAVEAFRISSWCSTTVFNEEDCDGAAEGQAVVEGGGAAQAAAGPRGGSERGCDWRWEVGSRCEEEGGLVWCGRLGVGHRRWGWFCGMWQWPSGLYHSTATTPPWRFPLNNRHGGHSPEAGWPWRLWLENSSKRAPEPDSCRLTPNELSA